MTSVSVFDDWNDGESDAEYCANRFGSNWEYLVPDDYYPEIETEVFYLLFTPKTQHLKIGKAKDFDNLLLRLQERRRQCGHTFILGFKECSKATEEEAFWKDYLKDHAVSREVFDLSFCDSDFRWLERLCLRRSIFENAERETDVNVPWFRKVIKGIDIEKGIKEGWLFDD